MQDMDMAQNTKHSRKEENPVLDFANMQIFHLEKRVAELTATVLGPKSQSPDVPFREAASWDQRSVRGSGKAPCLLAGLLGEDSPRLNLTLPPTDGPLDCEFGRGAMGMPHLQLAVMKHGHCAEAGTEALGLHAKAWLPDSSSARSQGPGTAQAPPDPV